MIIYQNPAGIGWLDGSDCDQPIALIDFFGGICHFSCTECFVKMSVSGNTKYLDYLHILQENDNVSYDTEVGKRGVSAINVRLKQ